MSYKIRKEKKKNKGDEIWLLAYADLITNLLIFFVAMLSVAEISQVKMQHVSEKLTGQRSEHSLSKIQEKLKEIIDAEGYDKVVSTELTQKGLEISINSGVVFGSGSDQIEKKYEYILTNVVSQIAEYSNGYRFAVEGHTDSRPLNGGSKFRSNWELASARAHQVRRKIEKVGIPHTKLQTESYADTKQLSQKKLKGLSDNDIESRHRRVIIRIF